MFGLPLISHCDSISFLSQARPTNKALDLSIYLSIIGILLPLAQ